MKTLRNLFSLLLTLTLLLCTASGAAAETTDDGFVDYVAQLKLNMSSATAKTSATVRTHVDGDTVHFDVPESVCADGVLKARFLALNTPESTGKIEEYGVRLVDFSKITEEENKFCSGERSFVVDSRNSTHVTHCVYVCLFYRT